MEQPGHPKLSLNKPVGDGPNRKGVPASKKAHQGELATRMVGYKEFLTMPSDFSGESVSSLRLRGWLSKLLMQNIALRSTGIREFILNPM